MKKLFIIMILSLTAGLFAQDITNTVGSNGKFTVKDDTETLMTINQSDGNVGVGTAPTSDKMTVNGNIIGDNLPASVNSATKTLTWTGDHGPASENYTGYYVQIGPILIQWGTFNATDDFGVFYSDVTVNFPTSFGNTTYSITISPVSTSSSTYTQNPMGSISSKSATSFDIDTYRFNNRDINYIAIGVAPAP